MKVPTGQDHYPTEQELIRKLSLAIDLKCRPAVARILWWDLVDAGRTHRREHRFYPEGLPRIYALTRMMRDDVHRPPQEVMVECLVKCGYTPHRAVNRMKGWSRWDEHRDKRAPDPDSRGVSARLYRRVD